jgi:glycosyltransferase involved in cell wall biosynthesis
MATALSAVLSTTDLRLIGRRRDAVGLPQGIESRFRAAGPYPAWIEFQSASDAKRVGADIVHYSDGIVPVVRHGRTVLAVHDLSVIRLWRMHRMWSWARIPLVLASPHLVDLVIVPSQATADEVVAICRIPASRIEIIPYAPQPDVHEAADESITEVLGRHGLGRRGYILSVGTIEPRKNHLRLIRAFELLVAGGAVGSDIRLVIAGKPGWGSAPVLDAIAESPVSDRIVRPGYVSGADLPALLTGAGAVAYVSLYEGFGLPVVESLTCGSPTVTSNISSMPEVAGDAGFLVDPFDVEDIGRGLAEALQAGATDADSIRRVSQAQASKFSWDRAARQVLDAYASRL